MSDSTGFQDEIDYWTRELELVGPYAQITRKRLTREGRIGEHPTWIDPLIEYVRERSGTGAKPRAVDLGCGPLGTLGAAHEDGRLDVVGVDPLADAYATLRSRFGAFHPTPLVAGGGERLASLVGDGAIDLVYARNSLDHVQDVQAVFDQVARALRPGGVFVFEVTAWEGSRESYVGLHRFDFHVHDGALHVTDRDGHDALRLSDPGLVLVALEPSETPHVAGLESVALPIRAVLVNARGADEVRRVAHTFERGTRFVRADAWLREGSALASRVANGWPRDLRASQYPTWADAPLARLVGERKRPLVVVETEAGVVPAFAGVGSELASRRTFDAGARRFAAIFEARRIPLPDDVQHAEPDAALAALAPSSLDVLHLHDALWSAREPHALLALAARALAPGGLLLLEGPELVDSAAGWREPASLALAFAAGEFVCTPRGSPHVGARRSSSPLGRLTVVESQRAIVDDPLRGHRRVARWILAAN